MMTFPARLCVVLLLPLLALLSAPHAVGAASSRKPLTRQEFQQRLRMVQSGARENLDTLEWDVERPEPPNSRRAEVVRLLGEPDRVERQDELRNTIAGAERVRYLDRLHYGCVQPEGMATLGSVDVTREGMVIRTRGGHPSTIPPDVVPEPRLRDLLQRIHRLPDWYWEDEQRAWNVSEAAALINALRELGEERAIAVMREYSRVLSVHEGPMWWHPVESPRLWTLSVALWPDPRPEQLQYGPKVLVLKGAPFFLPFQGGIGGSVQFPIDSLRQGTRGGIWQKARLRPEGELKLEVYLAELRKQPGWEELTTHQRSAWETAIKKQYACWRNHGTAAVPQGAAR